MDIYGEKENNILNMHKYIFFEKILIVCIHQSIAASYCMHIRLSKTGLELIRRVLGLHVKLGQTVWLG